MPAIHIIYVSNSTIVQSNLGTSLVGVADRLIAAAHSFSTVFARRYQCARTRPILHPKRQFDRFSRFCVADSSFFLFVALRRQIFPQTAPSVGRGLLHPSNTWFFCSISDPPPIHPLSSAVASPGSEGRGQELGVCS